MKKSERIAALRQKVQTHSNYIEHYVNELAIERASLNKTNEELKELTKLLTLTKPLTAENTEENDVCPIVRQCQCKRDK